MNLKYLAIAAFFMVNTNMHANFFETATTCVKVPAVIAGGIGVLYATPIITKITLSGIHKLLRKSNAVIQEQCEKIDMKDAAEFIKKYQAILDILNENDEFAAYACCYTTCAALLCYGVAIISDSQPPSLLNNYKFYRFETT